MELLKVLTALLVVASVTHGQFSGSDCRTPTGAPGQCVIVNECPEFRELQRQIAQSIAPSNALSIIRRSICRFRPGSSLRVCCPTGPPPRPNPPPPPPRNTPPPPPPRPLLPDVTSESAGLSLLPRRCGVSTLVDRIILGEDAPLLAWPWMVLLRGRAPNGRSRWTCGGVLISDRYVLTAAHCVVSSARFELEFVRIGEHTLGRNPDCQKGVCGPSPQDIKVEDVIVHEQYRSPPGCSGCNDIALLRLSRPAQLNIRTVQPICLPINPEQDMGFSARAFKTKRAWVAGWGTTNPDTDTTSNVLQQTNLPLDDRFCSVDRRSYPDQDMVLCAGGELTDTCRGDSGGPLMLNNDDETRSFVVGIVSKGPFQCGSPRTQGIYTNVHHYIPWILRNLRP